MIEKYCKWEMEMRNGNENGNMSSMVNYVIRTIFFFFFFFNGKIFVLDDGIHTLAYFIKIVIIKKYCHSWKILWWWKNIMMMKKYCDDKKKLWWWKSIVIIKKDCDKSNMIVEVIRTNFRLLFFFYKKILQA